MKRIFILIFIPLVALSQGKGNDPKYLVVRGNATIQVPIDYLRISMVITTTDTISSNANEANRALIFKAFNILKRFSVADSDFQTLDNSSDKEESYREKVKYSIRYSSLFYLRNPILYDSLFKELVNLGNMKISVERLLSNRPHYYQGLAYKNAIKSARRNAEILLEGSNQKLGNIIKLIQGGDDVYRKYDDIDDLVYMHTPGALHRLPGIASERESSMITFRRKYFEQSAEVTVIYEIK